MQEKIIKIRQEYKELTKSSLKVELRSQNARYEDAKIRLTILKSIMKDI